MITIGLDTIIPIYKGPLRVINTEASNGKTDNTPNFTLFSQKKRQAKRDRERNFKSYIFV